MAETFYDVLGVDPDAEESAIDAAFRERIKDVHPDVNDSPQAQERSRKLIEAKEILTDEAERARYDRLGHDQYVRQADTDASWATDTSTRTASASATEWGAETDDASGSGDPTWAGRGDWRHRRRRNHGSRRTGDRRETGTRTETSDRESSSDGSNTDRTTQRDDSATTNAATSNSETRASASVRSGNVGGSVGWVTSGSHAVRNEPGRSGIGRGRLFPPTQSVVLLVAAFFSYPGLVFSSVYPGFSPIVNVVVGACTLALIVYLASMPEVGVYVFGGWTVFGTFVVLASTVEALSIVGLLVLGATWLPLGLTVLTYWALRW